ncbi:MAG: hypothetical protein WCX71_02300 [Candidatus Buchananbacteria bacterium]
MTTINDWGEILKVSLNEIWFRLVDLIPSILGAILIFIIGIIVARVLGKIVSQVVKKIYIDRAAETTGIKSALEKIGFKIEISQALGWLITWFLYVVVLVTAADVLGLSQISVFLTDIVLYLPNVIVAIIMLIVGIIISNFVQVLVKETSLAADLTVGDFLAQVAKWAILVFTVMAALIQLKVATELIQILFTGLVFMLALAGGIAFGLGGQDKARQLLEKITKK